MERRGAAMRPAREEAAKATAALLAAADQIGRDRRNRRRPQCLANGALPQTGQHHSRARRPRHRRLRPNRMLCTGSGNRSGGLDRTRSPSNAGERR